MNKVVLCMLLMISGCATAQSDRPYSPEIVLTVEENINWLHGQKFNFKQLKQEVLIARRVQKYSHSGRLNRDNIALNVGSQLWLTEKQFIDRTLLHEANQDMLVIDQNNEFEVVGSYTISNKHWWDRLDSYKKRMLIVEDESKNRFVILYFLLSSSNRDDLYDTDLGRIN